MTEEYALPLAWGAALVLVRWTRTQAPSSSAGLALGALGALAFFLRANLAGAAAAAALTMRCRCCSRAALCARSRAWRRAASGRRRVVAAPIIVWLAHGGALRAFWDQAIGYNLTYTQADCTQRLDLRHRRCLARDGHGAAAAPRGGARRLRARRLHGRGRASVARRVMLFALIWAAVELLLASISGRPTITTS